MNKLTDMLGKQVTIDYGDGEQLEGKLLGIADGGYFIEGEENYWFIPEANNVEGIYCSKR